MFSRKAKLTDPQYWLPCDITGWCMHCNGFVKTEFVKTRKVRISRVVYYDDVQQPGEYVEREYTENISHCKTCGNYVDLEKIPSYVMDRLAMIAGMLDADTR